MVQGTSDDLEAAALTSDQKQDEFIRDALAVRQRLGQSVMLTFDGLKMVDHVAATLTDLDPKTVGKAFNWVRTFVAENTCTAAGLAVLLGAGTLCSSKLVKTLAKAIEEAAKWPTAKKLALYQSLMFIRVFVAGIAPGTSLLFTTPIQMMEVTSSMEPGAKDHTMLITMAFAVLPNLLACSQRFSTFMWKHLSKVPPLGVAVSQVMEDAFNAGISDQEKAGNAIALGHFTPGSGTFTSLVAGMFVQSTLDLILSGELGISDDLFFNVGVKSFKDARGALDDAQVLLASAQLFKVFFSLCDNKYRDMTMHLVNTAIIQGGIIAYTMEDAEVQLWMPAAAILTSAIILPWTERFIVDRFMPRAQSPHEFCPDDSNPRRSSPYFE